MSSERAGSTVQLIAVRDGHTICVDVLASRFLRGRNTRRSEVSIEAGEVFVDVWAVEPRKSPSSGHQLVGAELPRWPDE